MKTKKKNSKYISEADILKAKTLGCLPESVVTKAAKKIMKYIHGVPLKGCEYVPGHFLNLSHNEWNDWDNELECAENLVRLLVEENDHSLKFCVDHQESPNMTNDYFSTVVLNSKQEFIIWEGGEADYECHRDKISGWAYSLRDALNQVVLDFYGIEEHARRKLDSHDAKKRVEEIDRKIKRHEGRLSKLKKEREWLSSGEGVKK